MRREGVLAAGEAQQPARATMSATETLRAAGREIGEERQRLAGGSPAAPAATAPASPSAQIDLHILIEAEKLIDETLRRHGRNATPEVRASLVADAYGLIISLIEDDIDEGKAIKAATNVVRLRSGGAK